MKVGVLAGTPVDTGMGVDYLKSRDASIECIPMMVAKRPVDCHLFQLLPMEEKHARYVEMFREVIDQGVRDFFVYCNSVSGTFDFPALAKELNIRIHTPLQVYEEMGRSYHKVAVIAANNQSTAGIEKSLYTHNPEISVLGVGYLDMVNSIEAGVSPADMVKQYHLDQLAAFFKMNGAQCMILGCTHFPYFQKELSQVTDLKVVNPADIMYENLLKGMGEA